MLLAEAVPTTPAIETIARKLALLLPKSNPKQVLTDDKRMKWFKYQDLNEETENEFNNLLNEIKGIANEVKRCAEKQKGVTLRKNQPGEKRPKPTLERLDAGWVTVPAGYVAYLTSCASEDCVEAAVQVRANVKVESDYSIEGWLCGTGVVIFGCVSFRTEPAGIPYASIALPTSVLGEECED